MVVFSYAKMKNLDSGKAREQPLNFLTDYKAHLSSLTSQFHKVLYIGLNISIKIAGIKTELHCHSYQL